jgi:tRNA (guanine37-N1)-methyltransferase
MLRIDVVTLFPEVFAPLYSSIPARAQKSGAAQLVVHALRDWGLGKHRQVDDNPYGGGPGMVMSPPPLFAALQAVQAQAEPGRVIYLTPQGRPLDQKRVLQLAQLPRLILLCGHYEGIDERVIEHWVDEEICIGDFVVSGGELPAMMLVDALFRVLPGVLSPGSAEQDSFYAGLLDHPHYTRPAEFDGLRVPDVLLSGHHTQVERWRREQSLLRTQERRPDLYQRWLEHEEANSSARNRAVQIVEGVPNGQETHPGGTREQEEDPSGPHQQA